MLMKALNKVVFMLIRNPLYWGIDLVKQVLGMSALMFIVSRLIDEIHFGLTEYALYSLIVGSITPALVMWVK